MNKIFIACIVAGGLLLSHSPLYAATYPNGFTESTVVSGLAQPIALAFAPDGRIFVTEKAGKIRVIKNGQLLSEPFLTIPVTSDQERGLLGITLDPEFEINRHVYVYYTRVNEPIRNRVRRFTASNVNPDVAEAGSELILIDNIPGEHGWHNAGNINFGVDGKLYIATGDAVNRSHPQDLESLGGKLLRINKDGSIPSDNPFAASTTVRQEIWNLGYRNPFTFAIDPVDGRIFVNDVGEGSWEEINESVKGGNYGWPQCEGACSHPHYINPFYTYSHGEGKSISGGAFYRNNQFPSNYYGKYFFADYVHNFIKVLDPQTRTVQNFGSSVQTPVHLSVGPDGSLYYLSIWPGTLSKISYGTTTPPPPPPEPEGSEIKIYAAGQPAHGVYPDLELLLNDTVVQTFRNIQGNPWERIFQEFRFSQSTAITPSMVKLRYINDFYGGSGADRNVAVDKIVIDSVEYQTEDLTTHSTGTWAPGSDCNPGNKQSEWLHCNGYFAFSDTSTPPPENQTPTATITSPPEGHVYTAGDIIFYSGTAHDPEDGNLPQEHYTWNIIFHHDDHTHPFLGPIEGVTNGSFQIPDVGELSPNVWYRIHLLVRDSKGKTYNTYRDIIPKKVAVTVTTNPSGLEIELDSQATTSPVSFTSVAGLKRTLSAPSLQTQDGITYEFVSWSDGGAQTRTISPTETTTYTATFRSIDSPPPPEPEGSEIKIYAAGQAAQGIYPTLQLRIQDQAVALFTNIRGNPWERITEEFTYRSSTPVTASQITLHFTNDFYDSATNQDRNVFVDKIMINGIDHQTESPAVYSTGTWESSTGCAPGNKRSEWLHCSGYFKFE